MYERVSEGGASSSEKSIERGVSDPLKTAGSNTYVSSFPSRIQPILVIDALFQPSALIRFLKRLARGWPKI